MVPPWQKLLTQCASRRPDMKSLTLIRGEKLWLAAHSNWPLGFSHSQSSESKLPRLKMLWKQPTMDDTWPFHRSSGAISLMVETLTWGLSQSAADGKSCFWCQWLWRHWQSLWMWGCWEVMVDGWWLMVGGWWLMVEKEEEVATVFTDCQTVIEEGKPTRTSEYQWKSSGV